MLSLGDSCSDSSYILALAFLHWDCTAGALHKVVKMHVKIVMLFLRNDEQSFVPALLSKA